MTVSLNDKRIRLATAMIFVPGLPIVVTQHRICGIIILRRRMNVGATLRSRMSAT